MKILHIATHFGTTTVYNNLFAQLKKQGYTMSYIVSNRNHDYEELESGYTQLRHLPFVYKLFSALKAKLFGKQMINENFQTDFETIHAHTVLADGLLALFIKKHIQPNCKLIVTVRSTDLKYRYRLLWWERPAFRKVLKAADVITVLSPAYRDRLLKINKKWAAKIAVVPNGIAKEMSSDARIVDINKSDDFLFVGRIIPRKNVHLLLLAFKDYKTKYKDSGALYLVGSNGPGWYSKIVRYFSGLTKNVHFVGKLSQAETYAYMSKCKVLVGPSFSESFGLVYLEALANNMIVIGSKGEGVAGYFDESQGFFLAEPISIQSIFENMEKAQNVISRTEVSLSSFSWPNVAASYAALYSNKSVD